MTSLVSNKLAFWLYPPLFILARMLADKCGEVCEKIISVKCCRTLAAIGNLHAMHGLPSILDHHNQNYSCNAYYFCLINKYLYVQKKTLK